MTGMAISPHPLATEAGRAVLEQGGNAVEAAIAVNAVLAVVCPHFCGLGGDAVWLVADADGEASGLLGIGQALAAARLENAIPLRGPGSVLTTAAVVDLWDKALGRFPGRFEFDALLAPAIALAEAGSPISASQVHWLDFRGDVTADWPGFDSVFRPNGRTPQVGERFVQPMLAASLRRLAEAGPQDFYNGTLARRILSELNTLGIPITADDLAATRTLQVEPLRLGYRGLTLLAPPPPTQGLTTLQIMGILSAFDFAGIAEESADHLHLVVEAVKQAFLDRGEIADPDFVDVDVARLLAGSRLRAKAGKIDKTALPWPPTFQPADTVYFATVDAMGACVSALQSTYFDWGSGVIAGDTGILWQNRGAAFSTDPAHPNVLAPGKRPFYTLNPGMALRNGRPHLLYGTQGADGQPQTLAMLLTRLIDYGRSPAEALTAGRFLLGRTFSDSNDTLKLEGRQVVNIAAFSPLAGQAGVISLGENGALLGSHDPRGEGTASRID
jgi:oxamate amidohydrolase